MSTSSVTDVDGSESSIWLAVGAAVAVQALFSVGLHTWARWVARQKGGTAFWRRSAWLPLVALGGAIIGASVSAFFLIRAFDSVADADPSVRASLLAENISGAMNATAVFGLPSQLLYVVSFVLCVYGSLQRRQGMNSSSP